MQRRNLLIIISGISFIFLFAFHGIGQTLGPLTPDIRVDQEPPTNSGTHRPAIAMNEDNLIMIVWTKQVSAQISKVFGRIFLSSGEPLTAEFQIDQSLPEESVVSLKMDVATDTYGNFYVVWEDNRRVDAYNIYGRVFNSKGNALSNEMMLNEDARKVGKSRSPALAINRGNIVMLVWVVEEANIMTRFFRIPQIGVIEPAAGDIQVDQNRRIIRFAKEPRVAAAPDGNFVATWVDTRIEIFSNTGTPMVFARQYYPDGQALGDDFVVKEETPKSVVDCSHPDVVVDSQNNMIFIWNDERQLVKDGFRTIYSRIMVWDRKPITGDVAIDFCTNHEKPVIQIDSSDLFTIAFTQNLFAESDPKASLDHLFARRFRNGYQQVGEIMQIDQGSTVKLNTYHDLAVNKEGELFNTWSYNALVDTINFEQTGHIFFNKFGESLLPPPFNLVAQETGTETISWAWQWQGQTEYNANFYFKDENNNVVSPAIPLEVREWKDIGLAPNTLITRSVFLAYESSETQPSNIVRTYTLAAPPAQLQAVSVLDNQITLNWEGKNATRFSVERADDIAGQTGEWQFIVQWQDSLNQPKFTDVGLQPNKAYWYRVRAYNGDGVITLPATPVRLVTEDIIIQPPTLFSGEVLSDSAIFWQWQDNSDNEIGFLLVDQNLAPVTELISADSSSWLETGLESNTMFIRQVMGVGPAERTSDFSNADSAVTLALPPFQISVSDTTSTSIRLHWEAENVSAFFIQRAELPGDNWIVRKDWSDQFTQTDFTDVDLVPNTAYQYQVQSYNLVGVLNEIAVNIKVSTLPFAGPTQFQGQATSPETIVWSWHDNALDETGYQLFSAQGEAVSDILPPNTTEWTTTDLMPNQEYIRYVQVLPPGEQPPILSRLDSVFTFALPPANLQVIDSSSTSILLKWNGNGATQFAIERAVDEIQDSTSWQTIRNWSHYLTDTEFQDTGLNPLRWYFYRIRGYNGAQVLTSPCQMVSIRTPASALNPPTQLVGEVISPYQIDWFWMDNSDNEIEFRIKDENQEIISGDLPANTTTWRDSNLTINTRYFRQVFAVNAAGAESGGSNMSAYFTLAIPPSNLELQRSPNSVLLGWDGHHASFYEVERAEDNQNEPGEWIGITTQLTDTIYQDDNLDAGKSYWYRVYAYNGDSIRTAPAAAVLAAYQEQETMIGDLNGNFQIDFEDLDRLIDIVLGKLDADSLSERTRLAANFYAADEHIDINDIIAMVDTLLGSPALFRLAENSAGPAIQIGLEITQTAAYSDLRLRLEQHERFTILALQFSVSPKIDLPIETIIDPAFQEYNCATRMIDGKFRLIVYPAKIEQAKTDSPPFIDFRIAPEKDVTVQLEHVQLVDRKKRIRRIAVDQQILRISPPAVVQNFGLAQNYPNPFNASTEIQFHCETQSELVSLSIYNLLGQKIKSLLNNEPLAGLQKINWNGKDETRQDVPSGIYLYHLDINGQRLTKKMIVLR